MVYMERLHYIRMIHTCCILFKTSTLHAQHVWHTFCASRGKYSCKEKQVLCTVQGPYIRIKDLQGR